jgi:DNA-binding MarR family transcriptional regulator
MQMVLGVAARASSGAGPDLYAPDRMDESVSHSTARLLLLLARFGETVSQAMRVAAGEPEVVGNAPILVLSSIDLHGPQRPSDLSKLTGLSTGGLSKLLDRMEQLGAIRRERGVVAGDRRAVLVSLTDRGTAVLRALTTELAARLPETRALVVEISDVLASVRPPG